MNIHYCCVLLLGLSPFFATNAGATTNKGGIYCEGQKCFIEISKSSLDEYCEAAGSGITTEMPDTTTYAATGTHRPQHTTAEVTEPISQYYPSTTRRNSHCPRHWLECNCGTREEKIVEDTESGCLYCYCSDHHRPQRRYTTRRLHHHYRDNHHKRH